MPVLVSSLIMQIAQLLFVQGELLEQLCGHVAVGQQSHAPTCPASNAAAPPRLAAL
jgi:hypothetical protein